MIKNSNESIKKPEIIVETNSGMMSLNVIISNDFPIPKVTIIGNIIPP